MKLTKDQAWRKALDEAIAHHVATSQKAKGTTQAMLTALYTGLRVVRETMEADTLRTNDIKQLIACALDCLGAAYYDASQSGQELTYPPGKEKTFANDPTERGRLCRLANREIDDLVDRLEAAGMPGHGICAALIVKYAALANETGASVTQCLEVAAERIALEYGDERVDAELPEHLRDRFPDAPPKGKPS